MDQRVAAVAERQNAIVSTAQLLAAGLDQPAIDNRLRRGRLYPVHRGVYAVGHRPLTVEAGWHAAVLACGADAVLSHLDAALLWGLLRPFGRHAIHVTVPRRGIRSRPGIRVHTCRLPTTDVTRHRAVPVTTPARTIADIAATASDAALRRAVRQAEVERLTDLAAITAQLRPGRRGAARLRALVAAGPAPTRSELEDRTLALLADHDFPRPQINATVHAGTRAYEVDFLFARQRLIVEADGERYHGTRLARESDAAKQAALEAAGYRVVRLTWQQVTRDGTQTAARLRQIIGT